MTHKEIFFISTFSLLKKENQMLVHFLGLQTLNTAPHTIHLGASSLSVDLAVQEAIAAVVFKLATVVLMFLKC